MDGDRQPPVAVGAVSAPPALRRLGRRGFDVDIESVAALGDVGDVETGQAQPGIAVEAVAARIGNGRIGYQGLGLSGVQRLCGNSH